MSAPCTKFRVPITAITVFGTGALLALTVGTVLLLGFGQAVESTRLLWAEQAKTLIDSMERSLDAWLAPIGDQARWVAGDVHDLSDLEALDPYMFGVLAATPQVAGTAIITESGYSRRWHREPRRAIGEDWSHQPWMNEYLAQVRGGGGPAWREPIFTDTIGTSTLLHDVALRDAHGRFIGVFAQIVPVREFSAFLSRTHADTGITPFVLYDRTSVLVHPALAGGAPGKILPSIEDLGDLVLARIWSPDEDASFISAALVDTRASGVFWGDDYYLFLSRTIARYGPAPWTIGAYLNTTLLSNARTERILRALGAGVVVLVLGLAVSTWVGNRVSAPVKAIVGAARAVERGDLDRVPALGGSHVRELDQAGGAFNDMVEGLRERRLIRETLGRYVPERMAGALLAGGGSIDVQHTEATILFCDIESFTRLTETLGPVKIVDVLNAYFSAMVERLEAHGGVVTQFQGDAILATFNVPLADPEHARNAVAAAGEMLACASGGRFAGERLAIRIGINTGTVVAGAVGASGRLNYTVHGDAVNLAARLEALNKDHGTRVLISNSTAALVPGVEFVAVGETTVRGQTRSTRLFTLAPFAARRPERSERIES